MTSSLGPGLPQGRAVNTEAFFSQLDKWHSALNKKIDLVALGKFVDANEEYFTQSHTFSKEPADKCQVLRTVIREKLGGFSEKSIPLRDTRFALPYWEKMTPTEKKASLECVEAILSSDDELALSMDALKLTGHKSSHLWSYVGNKEGINEYHLKDEYDESKTEDANWALERKQRKIYPAVEMSPSRVKLLFDTEEADKTTIPPGLIKGVYKSMSLRDAYKTYGLKLFSSLPNDYRQRVMSLVFEELGFSVKQGSDGKVLFIPDVKIFLERWATLQKKNPNLANFTILTVGGISTDDPFIRAYFIYTALVSADEEFIHDMTIHVTSLIQLLVNFAANGKPFDEYKYILDREHFSLYRKIFSAEHHQNQLDKSFPLSAAELALLKQSLGVLVDTRWARNTEDTRLSNPGPYPPTPLRNLLDLVKEKDIGHGNPERLPHVWEKLNLATAPIYGLPAELHFTVVNKLFEENPTLPAIADSRQLHFRGGKSFHYTINKENDTYKLRVKISGHDYEIDLGKERIISAEALKKLLTQIQQNEKTWH